MNKTKNELNGNSYVGNPYVRFDEGNVALARPRQRKILRPHRFKFFMAAMFMLCGVQAVLSATYTEIEPNGYVEYTDWLGLPSSKWQEHNLGQLVGDNVLKGEIKSKPYEDLLGYDLFRYTPKISGTVTLSVSGSVMCESYDCSYFGTSGCAFGYALSTTRFILRTFSEGNVLSFDGVAGFTYYIRIGPDIVGQYTIYLSMPGESPTTYAVTYMPGAYGNGAQQADTKTKDVALTLRGILFTRSGYTQTGWATSDGGSKVYDFYDVYASNSAITLYPYWTPNAVPTYTVAYKPGAYGSGSQQSDTKTKDVALTLRGAIFTRSGYEQTGWATSDGGSKAYDIYDVYASNSSITLYPYWTALPTYTIYYKPGAYGVGQERTDIKTKDVPLKLKGAIFTRKGYTQTGWTTKSPIPKTGQIVDEYGLYESYTKNLSETLYPIWTPNMYTVTFDANGGNGIMPAKEVEYDTDVTLPDATFYKNGFVVIGWAKSATGGVEYLAGQTVSNLTAQANGVVTLYAVWQADNICTVSFDANGGIGHMNSQLFYIDKVAKLPPCTFTAPAGKRFAGWRRKDNGRRYDDGVMVFDLAAPGEVVTLTAIWE